MDVINKLKELENLNKWLEAKDLLYFNWNEDKSNDKKLLRMATECWYVLNNWEFYHLPDDKYDEFKNVLIETFSYALEYKSADDNILAVFGYMVSLFPSYFYSSIEDCDEMFRKYEQLGKDFIKKALEINPSNLFAKIFCLNDSKNLKKEEVEKYLNKNFNNDTEVNNYFREMITMQLENLR